MLRSDGGGRPFLSARTLRALWTLGLPTVLEEALQTAVSYIDTAMVGHINAQASAAVGLTGNVTWLLMGIFYAISVALMAFSSQSSGAGDRDSVRKVSVQAMWAVAVLGAAATAAALALAPFLPRWMGADPEIHADASLYFAIISAPMLFRASSCIFGYVLRANHDSKTPMLINATMNLINVVFNQLLIGSGTTFRLLGMEFFLPGAGWGVKGAAAATAISVVFGGTAMFIAVMRDPVTTLKGQSLKPDWKIMKICGRIAAPLALERVLFSSAQVVFTSFVAGLGTLATAAHSIALTVEQAFYIPGYGLQAATSILVGNSVGARDEEEFKNVRRAALVTAVSLMSAMAIFLFLFPKTMLGIFTEDPNVVELGAVLLRIVAVSEPLFAVLIITEGVFMGLGETKAPVIITTIAVWLVRVGGTALSVRLLGGGVEWAWVFMVADNMTRCGLLHLWYTMGRWRGRAGFLPLQRGEHR